MLIPVLGLVGTLVLLVLLITSRYKVAGPNQAFIVTGRKGKAVLNPETARSPPTCPGRRSSWVAAPS
jgi:flotillin